VWQDAGEQREGDEKSNQKGEGLSNRRRSLISKKSSSEGPGDHNQDKIDKCGGK